MNSIKSLVLVVLVGGINAIAIASSTAEQDIATEELLDSRCRGGGGAEGSAWASCNARDAAIKQLEKEGWCPGRSDSKNARWQWGPCHKSTHPKNANFQPSTPPIDPLTADIQYEDALAVKCYRGHLPIVQGDACHELTAAIDDIESRRQQALGSTGYSYFFAFHKQWLYRQVDECARLGMAGNEEMAETCKTPVLNANDFLAQLALGRGLGNPTLFQWAACSHELEANLELGARCIVAARDMAPCRPSPTNVNSIVDDYQCRMMFISGDWVANPKAQRISFDTPRPDTKDDFKIVPPAKPQP
jgi:hypothetical protein